MTNGEQILNAFPNATTRVCKNKGFTYIVVEQDDKWIADFDIEWWNAEYKDSATDCISKTKTLKAIDNLDKFGYTARYGLERLDKDDTGFVAYVKYDDVAKCIKGDDV